MTYYPLKPLSDHNLMKLRDIYEKHLPYASHVYSLITTYMKWKKLKKGENYLTFFTLRDDWSTTGTFIMQFCSYDLVVFTLEKNGNDLYEALTSSGILDAKRRVVLYGVLIEHYPIVLKALAYENITNFHTTEMRMYYIAKEKALEFEVTCPDDIYIGKLNTSHIPTISAIWAHRFDGCERYLSIFLEMNGGYGIFLKENSKLVAWTLRNHWGTLINLQTLSGYKRLGYGELILSFTAKKIAEEGLNPLATIVVGNFASETLFEKLGFTHLNTCRFVTVE